MRLLLARHGETDWNARGMLQGLTDVPLNERGQAQALELAARLREEGIGSVTTSDLGRALETGAIVARALGLAAPRIDADLRERGFGVFESLTREECAARHPEAWRAWLDQTTPPDGAEPLATAIARLNEALTRVAKESARERTATTLVVSHGGIMRLWLQDRLGTTLPPIGNGTFYEVRYEADGFYVTPRA